METKSKPIVLRYCPVVKHNVVLELSIDSELPIGKNDKVLSSCMNSHKCLNDRGGCTNKIFGCV